MASGRRLLLRNAVLVETPPEPPDPKVVAKQEAEAAQEKYKKDRDTFFESCTAERNRFIESKSEQSKTYDQTILTFSAGAIALSITFIEKIAPTPAASWLLYTAWGAFGLAVLAVVSSFVVSQEAFDNEIEWVDASWDAVKAGNNEPLEWRPNHYTALTRKLNFASGGFFFVGILFFVLFGIFNWPATKEPRTLKGTPIKIEITGEVIPGEMHVVTTTGDGAEAQKGDTPTPKLLPQTTTQVPAPSPATTTTLTTTQTTTTK